MNYGLYLSASGLMTNLYRQDVFANNLANANTVAFKPDVATVKQRDPEAIEDPGFGDQHRLLDRLGGGVLAGPQRVAHNPGPPQQTGRALDLLIDDPDAFFVLRGVDARTGETRVNLTRDGRFTLNEQGQLVTASGGQPVLDAGGQPIRVDPDRPVAIDGAGRVRQDGDVAGRLQLVRTPDREQLVKLGGNRFALPEGDPRLEPVSQPAVRSGFVEGSGVDPIRALMQVISATKAASGQGNMIRYHDLLMDRAVNTLGRVA